MKKLISLLLTLCMIFGTFAVVPFIASAATSSVSGIVYLSSLGSGVDLTLTGDTYLLVDTTKTLGNISGGENKTLWIQELSSSTSRKLTVGAITAREFHAVGSFSLDVRDGIDSKYNVEIKVPNISVVSRNNTAPAIYSRYNSVSVKADTFEASGLYGIKNDFGGVSLDIADSFKISGEKDAIVSGGAVSISGSGSIVSTFSDKNNYSGAGISARNDVTIRGDLTVSSGNKNCNTRSDGIYTSNGSIELVEGSVTVTGDGAGMRAAAGDILLTKGNVFVNVTGDYGIEAQERLLICCTADVTASEIAIVSHNGGLVVEVGNKSPIFIEYPRDGYSNGEYIRASVNCWYTHNVIKMKGLTGSFTLTGSSETLHPGDTLTFTAIGLPADAEPYKYMLQSHYGSLQNDPYWKDQYEDVQSMVSGDTYTITEDDQGKIFRVRIKGEGIEVHVKPNGERIYTPGTVTQYTDVLSVELTTYRLKFVESLYSEELLLPVYSVPVGESFVMPSYTYDDGIVVTDWADKKGNIYYPDRIAAGESILPKAPMKYYPLETAIVVRYEPGEGTGNAFEKLYRRDRYSGDASFKPEKCTFTPPYGCVFSHWQMQEGGFPYSPSDLMSSSKCITLTAVYTPIKYKVSFNENGGSGTMHWYSVPANVPYVLPACSFTPPKGKTFDRWDLGEVGDEVWITEDTTLKARWKDIIYKVTLRANNGTNQRAILNVKYGEKATLPDYSDYAFDMPTGHRFVRWTAGIPGQQIEVTADVTYEAVFEEVEAPEISHQPTEYIYDDDASHTMRIEWTGGTAPYTGTVAVSDDGVNWRNELTFTRSTGGLSLSVTAGDIGKYKRVTIVDAVGKSCATEPIKINTYVTITLDPARGNSSPESVRVIKGEHYYLPECTFYPPVGRVFDTWDLGQPGTVITPTEDLTVTALYKTEFGEAIFGSSFESADDVAGWTFLDIDGDGYTWGVSTDGQTTFEGQGKLYSESWRSGVGGLTPDNWAITPMIRLPFGTCTLSFYAAPSDTSYYEEEFEVYIGTSPDPENMTCLTGENPYMTDEYYDNYSFDLTEWQGKDVYIALRHVSDDQSSLCVDLFEVCCENPQESRKLTLWASYDAEEKEVLYTPAGGEIILPECPFEAPEGKKFHLWLCNGEVMNPGDSCTLDNYDLNCYAVWVNEYYTITFETYGGSLLTPQVVEAGVIPGEPDAPVKENCEFLGWQLPTIPRYYDFSEPLWGDITLYADWMEHDFSPWTIVAPTPEQSGHAERTCALHEGETQSLDLPFAFRNCTVRGEKVYISTAGLDKYDFRRYLTNGDFEVTYSIGDDALIGTGTTVEVTYAPGLSFTYTVVLIGDITGDGSINISDVTELLNILAGSNASDYLDIADLTDDGIISITDVTELLNILSGK